jgi:DNA primase
MIPPAFVQELLSRLDIVDLVGRQVQLRKAGANHLGLCPFHGEKTPSFTVSASKQFYHCFGCGANGDAIRFLTEHNGMSFIEAVHDLAQQIGLAVPEDERSPQDRERMAALKARQATLNEVLAKAAEHYQQQLLANPRALDYLRRRGLTREIAAAFGLGYAGDHWRGLAGVFPRYDDALLEESGLVIVQGETDAERKRYDRFRDRIMFPIRSVHGEVIGFGGRVLDKGEPKYLNSPETPVFVKGRELYGLHEARSALRQRGCALVVEGYMDVVALAQLGFPNAVATLGTACTAEHVQKLFRFTDSVVFSFDGDSAGRRAAARALEAALPHAGDTRTVRFLMLPAEHDPDSYIRAHGSEAFERQIAGALPLSQQLIDVAAQDCDLGQPEGRARMLAQARPLWSALPDGALRRQLLAELARRGGLPGDELASLWRTSGTPATRRAPSGRPIVSRHAGGLRIAPKRPEDRALQMLLAQPAWWDQLSAQDQEVLHGLPAPHGPLVTWLERELLEHGARPWAVVRVALLQSEEGQDPSATHALPDDADPQESTPADLRRALDHLLLRTLEARRNTLAAQASRDPEALAHYKALDLQWREVKSRQGIAYE